MNVIGHPLTLSENLPANALRIISILGENRNRIDS